MVNGGLLEARVRYPAGADFEGLQLSSPLTYKEVLCILRAAKLPFIKVGFEATFFAILYSNRQARVRYPAGADFEDLQLCSPLTYKDV